MRPFEVYARGDFEYQRAETLLVLGRPRDAARALEQALAACPRDDRRGVTLTRLRLAGVLLSLGRAEESHAQLDAVHEKFGDLRPGTLTRSAESLGRSLARVTHRLPGHVRGAVKGGRGQQPISWHPGLKVVP